MRRYVLHSPKKRAAICATALLCAGSPFVILTYICFDTYLVRQPAWMLVVWLGLAWLLAYAGSLVDERRRDWIR